MQNCPLLFTRLLNSISRVFSLARFGLLIAVIGGSFAISACTSAVDETQRAWMNKVFRPYVPDVVQGNFISSEQYAKLQVGMSREQVRQILGTPLLASYFHANRWDYVFEFKRAGQVMGKDRRVTVFFEGDKLVKFQGDALPTEVELVAEIDGYAKTKRSFWDVMTGSNKPPVTPPLQQPELLVPSPTDNLPAGAVVPAATTSSSFWDFFSFSKKQPEAQPDLQQLGPGALNAPQASEAK
ncbi:outer membrane protein assembly factor BamE [Polynucleobacter sp. AP-Nino-20-G2]|uniref:outer membrane protein assembly factor BamE n=1 Tax=Polynucleobacter sp. AP-Nino-20-G2 TaxID=2576917 RepID=UPI001BFD80AD|nr:outer membrane protein assembly factor BamE [Polynucleobacter sp. AP-Nino-20-G2]QWE16871.1 outer membrane protein assembly factor BamE [Polynucleobacter sp. AP-Nino-20-G2]